MRETDVLQKQIASFETLIVEKITESEAVEKELEERADEINSLDSKRDTVLSEFDAQVETDRAELEQESEHRKRAFETVPQRFASVYDRLAQRSRDGIAVAEVVNGSCSACFMSLRPQVLLEVKQGTQVVTCESCTRILYFATAASEAGAS